MIDDVLALKCGVATLIAFMILGALPAIPYFISWGIMKSTAPQTIPVIIIGVVQLFSLGLAKALMIGLNPLKSGIETLLVGAVITALGYVIGLAFAGKLWLKDNYLNYFCYHSCTPTSPSSSISPGPAHSMQNHFEFLYGKHLWCQYTDRQILQMFIGSKDSIEPQQSSQ